MNYVVSCIAGNENDSFYRYGSSLELSRQLTMAETIAHNIIVTDE